MLVCCRCEVIKQKSRIVLLLIYVIPPPFTRSAPHLTNAEAPAAVRKDQSNSDPKTSYSGIVENKFTTAESASGLAVGGGKEVLICTTVDRRYIPWRRESQPGNPEKEPKSE